MPAQFGHNDAMSQQQQDQVKEGQDRGCSSVKAIPCELAPAPAAANSQAMQRVQGLAAHHKSDTKQLCGCKRSVELACCCCQAAAQQHNLCTIACVAPHPVPSPRLRFLKVEAPKRSRSAAS